MLSRIKMPQFRTCSVKKAKPVIKPRVIVPQPLEKKINFDHEITEFEVRVAMSASVLMFSMAMLATRRGDPGMYLPMITGIISYWTPAPQKKAKD